VREPCSAVLVGCLACVDGCFHACIGSNILLLPPSPLLPPLYLLRAVQGRKGHRALKTLHFLLHFLPSTSVAEVVGRMTGHLLPALWAILEAKPTQHSYLDSRIGDLLFNVNTHTGMYVCMHLSVIYIYVRSAFTADE